MSADELVYAGIRELGGLFRRRELSPVDYATDLLARIERLDKRLNAFVTVTAERALADSGAATRGRWPAFPSRTRTSTPPAASSPPPARPCSRTGCRTSTAPASTACSARAW